MSGAPHPSHDEAADWLASNWSEAANSGPLTLQLRERFSLQFADAVKVIAEAKRRLGK